MASRGVNKVILIGNVGQDPQVQSLPSGGTVCNITLATSESWKDKQSGVQEERTEWHRVVFFNRLSEIAGEYLRKGSKVYIEGSLRTRKWQDKDGGDRYTTEIIANEMQMLDSNHQEGQHENADNRAPQQQQRGNQSQQNRNQQSRAPQQGRAGGGGGNSSNRNNGQQGGGYQGNRQRNSAAQPANFDDFDPDLPFNT